MGRPRKDQVEPGVESLPVQESKPENKVELKACPSCGGEAEVFKDRNGLYRCACKTCHFWDSVPHYDPLAAAASWNAAGGPNPVND